MFESGALGDRPGNSPCRRTSGIGRDSYIVERWAGHDPGVSPLQRQVRGLFAMLPAAQGSRLSGDELLHRSLTAHFVPFRSPRFEALEQPEESLAFASQLWTKLLERLDPKLIIAIDRRTTRELSRILKKKLGGTTLPPHSFKLGLVEDGRRASSPAASSPEGA